eukprot:3770884-Prymnesium_polylepis.2
MGGARVRCEWRTVRCESCTVRCGWRTGAVWMVQCGVNCARVRCEWRTVRCGWRTVHGAV